MKGAASLPSHLAAGLTKRHLPSLDGLRAVAAFTVVGYHFGWEWSPGGLGVLAFFVLSGFLITWLLLEEEERHGSISLKRFYTRRSLRIFPAFYAYWFLLVAAWLLFQKRVVVGQAIAAFFYVNNYYQAIQGDPNTGLSHTWSLGIEEQFYLIWPLVFLALRRNSRRIAFLIAGIGGVVLYREALVFLAHRDQGYIYEAFDTRGDHLMVGCLLAVGLRAGAAPGLWQKLCATPAMMWMTMGLLTLSTVLALRFGTLYRDAVAFVIDPLLIAALLTQTIAYSGTAMAAPLNWGWVRYLGTISYSIYLYQQPLVRPMTRMAESRSLPTFPVAIGAVLIAASASYWIVERPFLRLKKHFESPERAAAVPEPTVGARLSGQ